VSGGESTPVPPPTGQVATPASPEPAASPATQSTVGSVATDPAPEGPRDAANGLGVRCENLTLDLATAMKVPAGQGVLVVAVTTGSPADKAGIRPGDVISRAGGQPVPDVSHLDGILAAATTPLSIVTTRTGSTRVVAADLSQPVAPPKPAEPVVEPKPAVEMTQEQLIASLRDEVRSLRDEVRKLREEMSNWARATRPQP
jgi:membrane-associated protease RseP (regulator of RpoE activity)